ncbi:MULTISPECIES: hypothetical protein [Paenibacillus]|uniref:Uncharacterized protein n=2 Tax=Paenibacillus TaxID=44249 RepID=A0ABW9UCW0_9BACL|nr:MULTISPECIES: hypothetical protein [Paenibacillus]MBA2944108.1 hypothetical protein [Paenibacillus sp. CGMCC 1.16610]MEC0268352.1 hypothetical protein [Paenibacillus anseongense]MVQ37997.1 hypothetical protein [Paenibacillus anseongense]
MMMKILNVLLVMAACFFLLFMAFEAESPGKNQDPNPMKQNQTQFARIQQSYYAEDVNK